MRQTRHGFTLIEILIYMGVLGGIILGMSSLLGIVLDQTARTTMQQELAWMSDYLFAVFSDTIRESRQIIEPTDSAYFIVVEPLATTTLTKIEQADDRLLLQEGEAVYELTPSNIAVDFFQATRRASPSGAEGIFFELELRAKRPGFWPLGSDMTKTDAYFISQRL